MQKIGTSMSCCIKDIIRGKVSYFDVAFILTSTNYSSKEEMLHHESLSQINNYQQQYLVIAVLLWDEGKIFQSSNRNNKLNFLQNWIDVKDHFMWTDKDLDKFGT